MRESAIPYAAASALVNAWIERRDTQPIIDAVPDHLRDLVKYGARLVSEDIKRHANTARVDGIEAVPRAMRPAVKRYMEARSSGTKT